MGRFVCGITLASPSPRSAGRGPLEVSRATRSLVTRPATCSSFRCVDAMTRASALLIVCSLALGVIAGCLGHAPRVDPPTPSQIMLWSSPDPILVLQVDFEKGTQPGPRALDWVLQNLREVTHKKE